MCTADASIAAQRPLRQGQHKGSQALRRDGAQKPADVEAGRAQHRVQRIAVSVFEPAAIHAVIALGMADRRLDCLAPLEPLALLCIERPQLAAVNDLYRRAGLVDPRKPGPVLVSSLWLPPAQL
jgi:hypothetical protein